MKQIYLYNLPTRQRREQGADVDGGKKSLQSQRKHFIVSLPNSLLDIQRDMFTNQGFVDKSVDKRTLQNSRQDKQTKQKGFTVEIFHMNVFLVHPYV